MDGQAASQLSTARGAGQAHMSMLSRAWDSLGSRLARCYPGRCSGAWRGPTQTRVRTQGWRLGLPGSVCTGTGCRRRRRTRRPGSARSGPRHGRGRQSGRSPRCTRGRAWWRAPSTRRSRRQRRARIASWSGVLCNQGRTCGSGRHCRCCSPCSCRRCTPCTRRPPARCTGRGNGCTWRALRTCRAVRRCLWPGRRLSGTAAARRCGPQKGFELRGGRCSRSGAQSRAGGLAEHIYKEKSGR